MTNLQFLLLSVDLLHIKKMFLVKIFEWKQSIHYGDE